MPPKTPSATRAASTTVIRVAFLAEALGNVLGGLPMILNPEDTILMFITPEKSLDPLKAHPASLSDKPSPQAVLLAQWLGAIVIGLAVPLFLGALEDPQFVATRRMTYTTLGAGEVALVVTMLFQLASGAEEKGMTMTPVLVYSMIVLSSLCAWRFYVLTQKPEWVGDAEIALRRTPSGKRRSL